MTTRDKAALFSSLTLLAGAALPLTAEDPPTSPDAGSFVFHEPVNNVKYVRETTGKEVYAPLSLLPDSRFRVDLFAGSSYYYDSNNTLLFDGTGSSVFRFNYGFDLQGGNDSGRGGFWGLGYTGNAYVYDDSAARAGRDPYDNMFRASLGVNGAKTTIRLDSSYFQDSGNSIDFDQDYLEVYREARIAQSDNYTTNLRVVRDLPRGSLEAGFAYVYRDFASGTNLNDQNSWDGDLAWFFEPGFAPRTSLGFGFNFGKDNFQGNPDQFFWTPSLRWRYQLSGKTSVHSSLGYEFRDSEVVGGVNRDTHVYNGGVSWNPSSITDFDFSFYRDVRPSYVNLGQDYNATGLALSMNQKLPSNFTLSTSVGYENDDYVSTVAGAGAVREDNFLWYRIAVGHPLNFTDRVRGNVSVFYNYNDNDSNVLRSEFDQHVTGVSVGFKY